MLTFIIIGITVLISIVAFAQHGFFEKAKFNPYAISHHREWWRWMSGGFIHADYVHLGVNMLTLYFFGMNLEIHFYQSFAMNGFLLFSLLYVVAIPVSSMYDYYRYRNDPAYSAVGASGAVSAILFSSILFDPTSKIYLYFMIGIPAWLFGILYLIYSYYMGKKQADNVGHDAHFFGALFGLIFTILVKPDILQSFYLHLTQ